MPLHGRRGARHGLGGDHRQRPEGRHPGRAVRHRRQRPRDRRLDRAGAPTDPGDRPPRSPGPAPVPRGGPRRRHPPARGGAGRPRQAGGHRGRGRRGAGAALRAARRVGHRDDRGARGTGVAPGHLLHLQPRRLRAGARRVPRGRPLAARPDPAPGGRAGDRRGARGQPGAGRFRAQPDHLRGARTRDRAPSRGHPAEPQAAHRGPVRAWARPRRVRDRDDEPRDPHARPERRAAGPHQAHGPGLPGALDQRADPDGRARGAARHRPGGTVRDRPRRAGQPRGGAVGDRRRARADREPVSPRVRLGRPPRQDGARRGGHPADRRVLVRPAPEPAADPPARGRGRRVHGGGRRGGALRRAVRGVRAHRALPAPPRRGGRAPPEPRRPQPPGARPGARGRGARWSCSASGRAGEAWVSC